MEKRLKIESKIRMKSHLLTHRRPAYLRGKKQPNLRYTKAQQLFHWLARNQQIKVK